MENRAKKLSIAVICFLAFNAVLYFVFWQGLPKANMIKFTSVAMIMSAVVLYATLAGMGILSDRGVKFVSSLAGTSILLTFIIGLAYSISTGFAGFWGGLPFWVIAIIVLLMAVYDFWDACLRRNKNP